MPKGSTYPSMTALTGAEKLIGVQSPNTEVATVQQVSDFANVTAKAYTDNSVAGVVGGFGFFQNTGTGSQGRTFQNRMQDVVSYGDHSTLQQSLDEAYNSGKPFIGKKGATVTLTTTLTIKPNVIADFAGMTIIAGAGISTGNAIVLDGQISTSNPAGEIRNLTLIRALTSGHADTTSNVDGISIQGGSGAVSSVKFDNVRVFGFRDNIRFDGPNAYLNHFHNCQIGLCWRRAYAVYASSNSNENISIFGGNIFNANNTTFDAAGVYIDPGAGTTDIHLFGVSIDYCDKSIVQNQSEVAIYGCHLENNCNNPHVTMAYTSTKEKPRFMMFGGYMGGGPGTVSWTGIPVESATGRAAMIETTAGGSYDIAFEGRMAHVSSTSDCVTELVKQTAGLIRWAELKPVIDASTGTGNIIPPYISRSISALYVSTTALTGWTQSGTSGATLSFDGTDFSAPDAGSRKGVGTLGNSFSYQQTLPCKAGQCVVVRGKAKNDSISAGYLAMRIQFMAQDGTTVIKDVIGNQVTTAGSYQPVWAYEFAPKGTTSVKIWDYFNSYTGTGRFSDENAWVF